MLMIDKLSLKLVMCGDASFVIQHVRNVHNLTRRWRSHAFDWQSVGDGLLRYTVE